MPAERFRDLQSRSLHSATPPSRQPDRNGLCGTSLLPGIDYQRSEPEVRLRIGRPSGRSEVARAPSGTEVRAHLSSQLQL